MIQLKSKKLAYGELTEEDRENLLMIVKCHSILGLIKSAAFIAMDYLDLEMPEQYEYYAELINVLEDEVYNYARRSSEITNPQDFIILEDEARATFKHLLNRYGYDVIFPKIALFLGLNFHRQEIVKLCMDIGCKVKRKA